MRVVTQWLLWAWCPFAFCGDVPAVLGTDSQAATRVDDLMRRDAAQWPGSNAVVTRPSLQPSGDASPVLRETAKADDWVTRLTALEGYAVSDGAAHVDVFIHALSDPAVEVRQYAAHVLNRLDPMLFLEKVLALAQSEDEAVRVGVEAVLPLLRDSLEAPIAHMLTNEEEPVERRILAARVLGSLRSTTALGPLVDVAESTGEPKLARACVSALGAIPDGMVVPPLARLVDHPSPEVRYAALNALRDVSAPESTMALAEVAARPRPQEPAITVQAVAFLAERANRETIPLLISVMRRNTDAVSGVVGVLRRLTGEDFGDSAELWEQWWQRAQQAAAEAAQAPPMGAAVE